MQKKELIVPPPRFETHAGGLNMNVNRVYRAYENPNFNNQLWHSIEHNTLRVGFDSRPFGWDYVYYDGIWVRSVTILWIEFSVGFFWAAQPKEVA